MIWAKTDECITHQLIANGRNSATSPSYYVINKSTVEGSSALNGKTYLGRPWREFSRVVFQNSRLGAVVNPAGWSPWSQQEPKTNNVVYGEYGNTGPGARSNRKIGKQLSAPVSMNTILPGFSDWVDARYLE